MSWAGDFRKFWLKKFENGATGEFRKLEKPANGGLFLLLKEKILQNAECLAGDTVLIAPVREIRYKNCCGAAAFVRIPYAN